MSYSDLSSPFLGIEDEENYYLDENEEEEDAEEEGDKEEEGDDYNDYNFEE